MTKTGRQQRPPVRLPGLASNLCETSEGPRADADAEVLGDAPSEFLEGMSVRLTGLPLVGLNQQGQLNGRSGTLGKFRTELGRWEVLNVDDGWRVDTRLLKEENLCKTSAGPRARADAEVVEEASSEGMSVDRGPECEVLGEAIRPGLAVRLTDLVEQDELEGRAGTVINFDYSRRRWQVEVTESHETVAVRTCNLTAHWGSTQPDKAARARGAEIPIVSGRVTAWETAERKATRIRDELSEGTQVFVTGLRVQQQLNYQAGRLVKFDVASGRWELQLEDRILCIKPSNLTVYNEDDMKLSRYIVPARTLVESVVHCLMEGQILRPLNPWYVRFLCGNFQQRAGRRRVYTCTPESVFEILDYLYYFWFTERPVGLGKDLFVDRGMFSTSAPMNIWAYRKKTMRKQYEESSCRCVDPVAHPRPAPQIVLLSVESEQEDVQTGFFKPNRSQFHTDFWRWISVEDLAGCMLDDPGISLYCHYVYTVGQPLLECQGGHTHAEKYYAGRHRCKKCLFHFEEDSFRPASGMCILCTTQLWNCHQCDDEKEREDYPDGQWKHRHSRGAVCRECADKRCELCDCLVADEQHQCKQCHNYKTAAHFSESMWHNRLTRRMVCLACQGGPGRKATFQCQLCGEHFTAEGFTRGMWLHKSTKQRTLCKTCCRPLCTNAECRTCKTCRDPQCRARRHCEAEVQALNPKCLPQKAEELATWLCAKCTPTFCSRWPLCSKKRMSKTLYTTDQYTCGDCKK